MFQSVDFSVLLQVGIDPASMVDATGIVGTLHFKPKSRDSLDAPPPRTIIVEDIPPYRDTDMTLMRIIEAGANIIGKKSAIGYDKLLFVIDGTGVGNEKYAQLRSKLPNLKKINIHGNSKDGVTRRKGEPDTFGWSKHDMILTKRMMSRNCRITPRYNGPKLMEQIANYEEKEIGGQLTGEGKPDDLLIAWLLSLAKIPARGIIYEPDGARTLLRGLM